MMMMITMTIMKTMTTLIMTMIFRLTMMTTITRRIAMKLMITLGEKGDVSMTFLIMAIVMVVFLRL